MHTPCRRKEGLTLKRPLLAHQISVRRTLSLSTQRSSKSCSRRARERVKAPFQVTLHRAHCFSKPVVR
eukprot:3528002-Pleurochrysis_carterae.AAC.1